MYFRLKITYAYLLLGGVLYACGGDVKDIKTQKEIEYRNELINFSVFDSPDELNLSFPIWFNAEFVKSRNISSIKRSVFPKQPVSLQSTDSIPPSEIRTYHFDKKGALAQFEIEVYADARLVSREVYSYIRPADTNGFSEPKLVQHYDITSEYSDEKKSSRFEIYSMVNGFNVPVYDSDLKNTRLFFVINPKEWRNTSISRKFRPKARDLIVWGTPQRPVRKYHLTNQVNESEVSDFVYHRNTNTVISVSRTKYPFNYKRSYIFTTDGACSGYTDSTFSRDQFISSVQSDFVFEDRRPVLLKHHKKNEDSGYTAYETFSYTFFE